MTYIILLIIIPALAYASGWLSSKTGINFWFFFAPVLVLGALLYQFGGKIFKK